MSEAYRIQKQCFTKRYRSIYYRPVHLSHTKATHVYVHLHTQIDKNKKAVCLINSSAIKSNGPQEKGATMSRNKTNTTLASEASSNESKRIFHESFKSNSI